MYYYFRKCGGDGLIDFDDVSVVVDGSGVAVETNSRFAGSATRLTYKVSINRILLGILYPVPLLLCAFAACLP